MGRAGRRGNPGLVEPVTLPSPSSPALQIFPLISQSRWLVKSGELTALEFSISPGLRRKLNTRPVHLHLFNDCLLLSRPRESVTGMGGWSTGLGRGWGMGKARREDKKGLRGVVLPEETLNGPAHGVQVTARRGRTIQSKKGDPTK